METDWTESAKSLIPNQKGCKSAGLKYLLDFLGTNFPSIVWISYIIIDAMTKFFALGFYGVIYD